MNKPKITNGILFQPIGISDNLKPVNCQVNKPITNNYHNNMQYGHQKITINNQKLGSLNNNKQQIYNRDIKDRNRYNNNVHNQSKQYYWPTDIIQDQTGNTLKQFKSYLQSHKINSYIKLNLQTNNKNNKTIFNKIQLIDNVQTKKQKNSIITLNQYMGNDGQYQETYNKWNNNKQRVKQNNQSTAKNKYYGKQQIGSDRHSQKSKQSTRKCIKIDYQQFTVGRSISACMLRDKNKQTFCLDNRHRTASIKNGQNKIYIQTYVNQFNPHDKLSSQSKKSQRSAQFQKQYPSVDQNNKKRLTLNTSTHFQTIPSADIRDSDTYQNRNRKHNTNRNGDKYVNNVKHTGIINQDQQYENNHKKGHAYNTGNYSDQTQQITNLKNRAPKENKYEI